MTGRHSGYYVYGNTAKEIDVQHAIEEQPKKQLSIATRKNREKAYHMNLGYVSFLVMAMLVAGYVLIGYIRMQAELTTQMESIARLERQVYDQRLQNDENLTAINSSINLEEIKRIAIGELGMVYPTEGQIVKYTNEGSDYVRQMMDIPKE